MNVFMDFFNLDYATLLPLTDLFRCQIVLLLIMCLKCVAALAQSSVTRVIYTKTGTVKVTRGNATVTAKVKVEGLAGLDTKMTTLASGDVVNGGDAADKGAASFDSYALLTTNLTQAAIATALGINLYSSRSEMRKSGVKSITLGVWMCN